MNSAYDMLAKYNVIFAESGIASDANDAQRLADSIGYTVAMKISTDQPVHKTDLGLVKLNLGPDQIMSAYSEITKKAAEHGITFDGVVVQQTAKPDLEMIVGIKQDSQFGPVLLCGLGGIYTEIFHDTSIRLCPIEESDAKEMLAELKTSKIFESRGKRYNTGAFIDLLMKVSKIATTENIRELDLNPVFIYPENEKTGYMVADVRIVR